MVSLQEREINPPKDNSPYFGIIAEDAGLREENVMAFDFKKECKELYRPSAKPSIVTVPPMSYVAVRGKGNPNAEGGEYQKSIPQLYGISGAYPAGRVLQRRAHQGQAARRGQRRGL